MTIERAALLAFALCLSLFACVTERPGRRGGLSDERINNLPTDVAASYRVFEHKCSRCHTLSRPLNAAVYELEHWQAYVARMRKQPGSGISEADGERILVFLKHYAAEKKRAQLEAAGYVLTSTQAGGGG